MKEKEQQIIDELETVICRTRQTIKAFETNGMCESMSEDYEKLHDILDEAINHQQTRILANLGNETAEVH